MDANINITTSSRELRKQAHELLARADLYEKTEREQEYLDIEQIILKKGLSVEKFLAWAYASPRFAKPKHVDGRRGNRGLRPIKYRGPNGEAWSGIGRTPLWVVALATTNEGRKDALATFLIPTDAK